jgi:hypothetical protein
MEFRQPVLNDAANQARGVSHQGREMLGITRDRFLARARHQHLDKAKEWRSVMFGNGAIGARVILIGTKDALGYDDRVAAFVIAMEQSKLREIAGAPAAQFPKSFILALVVATPTRGIRRLVRRFQFDERPRRCAPPHQCDVRPSDTRIPKFWDDGQSWGGRQFSNDALQQ